MAHAQDSGAAATLKSKFYQRNVAPEKYNPYYTRYYNGGYSECIQGNTEYIPLSWTGCVLPNCVGYACGRFNEIGGYGKMKYNLNCNAKNFVTTALSKYGAKSSLPVREMLSSGQTPQVGAVLVWSNSKYGHVAIVEQVISNTEIIVSQSGWSAKKTFWRAKHKRGSDGNWLEGDDYGWMKGKYTFAGFVYQPAGLIPVPIEANYATPPAVSESSKAAAAQKAIDDAYVQSLNTALIKSYNNSKGMDLLSSTSLVESPYISVKIGGYVFGSYTKEGTLEKTTSKMYATYPNYMDSINIVKTNGTLNQYTINMIYQVEAGKDPNLLDRIFSTVSADRKITISYGDLSASSICNYREEEAIITKVTSNIEFGSQKISYTLSCVSTALKAQAQKYTFDAPNTNMKGSDIIKNLLANTKYGLADIFPGMKELQKVEDRNLIADDDKAIKLETKYMDVLSYLNYVVGCMTSNTTLDGQILKDSTYHLVIMDDVNSEFGGAYFKVVKIGTSARTLTSTDVYEVDIGYPTSTLVTEFKVNEDSEWSILYNYADKISTNKYVYTIGDDGKMYSEKINPVTISPIYNRATEINKTWWTQVTQHPIKATLTIKGLLRPAILMNYVRVHTYFFGQKHISSGLYVITKQEDTINSSGYRTTLSLTRIAGDEDETYSYTQTTTPTVDLTKYKNYYDDNTIW